MCVFNVKSRLFRFLKFPSHGIWDNQPIHHFLRLASIWARPWNEEILNRQFCAYGTGSNFPSDFETIMWAGGRWYGPGACAVEGGRVSWDCLDKKEDCQGRCGEGTARHAIFIGGTEGRKGWICFNFEFWCLPPLSLLDQWRMNETEQVTKGKSFIITNSW